MTSRQPSRSSRKTEPDPIRRKGRLRAAFFGVSDPGEAEREEQDAAERDARGGKAEAQQALLAAPRIRCADSPSARCAVMGAVV